MDILKIVFSWLVKSSADPAKLSLTIKSLAAFAVLFGIDSSVADEGVGHVVNIIVAVGMFASAISGAYGFVRKVKNTIAK